MARADQVFYARENLERQFGFAQSVRVGPMLFFSGVTSIDKHGAVMNKDDMAAQVNNVYTELKELLVTHGVSMENVVKETIYTTDMDALFKCAELRLAFIKDYAPPAATWVQVSRLAFPGLMLEVDWTLYVP